MKAYLYKWDDGLECNYVVIGEGTNPFVVSTGAILIEEGEVPEDLIPLVESDECYHDTLENYWMNVRDYLRGVGIGPATKE
jgi:hypothetical protein